MPNPASITPPLLNSANPWASTPSDLQSLYDSPSTGAVTVRTSVLGGFPHDDGRHQYLFFSAGRGTGRRSGAVRDDGSNGSDARTGNGEGTSSLNTFGYSPIGVEEYVQIARGIVEKGEAGRQKKPFILSVAGSPADVGVMYALICEAAAATTERTAALDLRMEINLSCPNIPSEPPPAYSREGLLGYLRVLQRERRRRGDAGVVPIGIKVPPYTYHTQFVELMGALEDVAPDCPVDFITATNTLGGCLALEEKGDGRPALASAAGTGIGGLAGAALHPLALGTVKTLRTLLDESEALRRIEIIGVGGVSDRAGFERMLAVGASAVAVGTALGTDGVEVFERILRH
ncbi:MAG: dihydroorotate dehydrogenase [Piccolia ochrophora]|nr:MAG: dihydroorotate dehydrogenase [Piccolia ochrophora]